MKKINIVCCMGMLVVANYALGSEKNVAHNTSISSSMYHYVDVMKNEVNSFGLYCQRMLHQVVDYCYTTFTKYGMTPLTSAHDVIIQILGKRAPIIIDDEDLGGEGKDEQDDICPAGDKVCQRNLNFFNRTFFSGLLNLYDQNPADIDIRDNEYRRMRMQQLKLLYGQDASHESQEFNYNE